MAVREVEHPDLKDLLGFSRDNDPVLSEGPMAGTRFVGSGKGGMAIIFKYLLEKKIIENKLAEVMVPDWLGFWIYNQIQSFAFPAKNISNRTKVIYVYHQYGFPQDMDAVLDFAKTKKLIVIEDCAHALESFYKGKILGSFGDFSIYSFSKWFFCFALGGVKSKFSDFDMYVQKSVSGTPWGLTFIKDGGKFLYESAGVSESPWQKKYSKILLNMTYAIYGEALKSGPRAVYLAKNKMREEINIRKLRYKIFREKTDRFGVCDHLETEGVVPYVIPIRCPEQKMGAMVEALRHIKVDTGIYHFDRNRNLLSPQFVPCIWIPCHGSIPENIYHQMVETVTSICSKN